MIAHAKFGELRLAHFQPEAKITQLTNWEFMESIWVGEAIGFSEWLRLESDPHVLRSLAINFSSFPQTAAINVLQTIDLSIRAGMDLSELRAILGEPVKEYRFVKDRITYDFILKGPPQYRISCTVLHKGGLTYLVIMAPLPK